MVDREVLISSLEKTLSKPVFQAAIAKALAESIADTMADVQQDQADLAEHMSQAKPPEAFGPGLKVMGHAIVHNTGNPQWDRKRVELLAYCKVSGKYLVRTMYPQGCGANEITWIDRESINHPQCDQEYPQPAEPPKQSLELPDGWRWLEIGEVIRKGDEFFKDDNCWDYDLSIGERIWDGGWPSIRRNRFEIGELVVPPRYPGFAGEIYTVCYVDENRSLVRVIHNISGSVYEFAANALAPYVEDSK